MFSFLSKLKPKDRPAGTQPASPPSPFVVGVGRSGTTLLRVMLDSHPAMAMARETHFIPKAAEACEGHSAPQLAFIDALVSSRHWNRHQIGEEELRAKVEAISPFDLGEALRAFYRLVAEKASKPRWGEKTPAYAAHMLLIQDLLPEAHFIHIIRDGRDVALSVKEVNFGPDSVEDGARWWLRRIENACGQVDSLAHYLEVRYEELVLDTENSLRRICEFIDLQFDPVMLRYYENVSGGRIHPLLSHPPEPNRIGRWKREMSPSELSRVEEIAGDKLREFGYEV